MEGEQAMVTALQAKLRATAAHFVEEGRGQQLEAALLNLARA
jgi:hypothetical protein